MRNKEGKLTDEQVKEMLLKLEDHFGEPVRPVSDYCKAFETWFGVVTKKAMQAGDRQTITSMNSVRISIKKSNLLARLIYGGEKLRTKECPIHKGKWNGQAMLMGCEHNCDGTGWLREPEDENAPGGVDGK
jgi:hypothetical protein